uniref:Uncharacterized protein n=1 Tax=Romanomermis culicivorax TaxID=13658 RepID=A0A915JK38_ROMCU
VLYSTFKRPSIVRILSPRICNRSPAPRPVLVPAVLTDWLIG